MIAQMYLPRAFAQHDLAALDALFEADPFVTLISTDDDGAPFVSHLPVLYTRRMQDIVVEGHWARANPQARHRGPMTMIVHGPHAYVSPGWYPDKEQAARVPTWNYAVAHLTGMPLIYEDDTELGRLLDRMSRHFEARIGSDWRFDPEREAFRAQLRGIVGFRLVPSDLVMKFKLSQNHPPANRAAVREAFARSGDPGAARLAAWMAEHETEHSPAPHTPSE